MLIYKHFTLFIVKSKPTLTLKKLNLTYHFLKYMIIRYLKISKSQKSNFFEIEVFAPKN